MKLLLTLVTVSTVLAKPHADEAKESRYIDENALKAILELTRQPTPTNTAVTLKHQYPYLSQKEKLTLQGERQTNYPVQSLNFEYAFLPQVHPATQTKDTLIDVKSIYVPYPLKNQQPLTTQAALQALAGYQATAESTQTQIKPSYVTSYSIHNPTAEPAKPSAFFAAFSKLQQKEPTTSGNLYLGHKPPIYPPHPNLFAYANQASSHQLVYPHQSHPASSYQGYSNVASSPSFIIINPMNYPSYHYYTATNYTLPRGVAAIADDSLEPIELEVEHPDQIKDLRLETVDSGQTSANGTPLEAAPILTILPNGLTNDERALAQALLEQSRQPETFNALLELLKREQLKRRMQERVAAFYFRNLEANKK